MCNGHADGTGLTVRGSGGTAQHSMPRSENADNRVDRHAVAEWMNNVEWECVAPMPLMSSRALDLSLNVLTYHGKI